MKNDNDDSMNVGNREHDENETMKETSGNDIGYNVSPTNEKTTFNGEAFKKIYEDELGDIDKNINKSLKEAELKFHGYTLINFQAILDQELSRIEENEQVIEEANQVIAESEEKYAKVMKIVDILPYFMIGTVVVSVFLFLLSLSAYVTYLVVFMSILTLAIFTYGNKTMSKIEKNIEKIKDYVDKFDEDTVKFWERIWGSREHPEINLVKIEGDYDESEHNLDEFYKENNNLYMVEVVVNDEKHVVGYMKEDHPVYVQLKEIMDKADDTENEDDDMDY